MDIKLVTIESDVVETIFRPISLFLNDVPAGTKFTLIGHDSTPSRRNPKEFVHHYKFFATNGETYSFTQYDFGHFTVNGDALQKVFTRQHGKDATLQSSFTVLGMTERKTRKGVTMYPPFAYSGNEDFLDAVDANPNDTRNAKKALYDSEILPDYKDRYYRVVDIDVSPLYYED